MSGFSLFTTKSTLWPPRPLAPPRHLTTLSLVPYAKACANSGKSFGRPPSEGLRAGSSSAKGPRGRSLGLGGCLGEPPLLWAEFPISAMRRLWPFQLTHSHSYPLLLALELGPGNRVSREAIPRFKSTLAPLSSVYYAPPRPRHLCSKKTCFSPAPGLGHRRGATCCPRGASAASDGGGAGLI